MGEQFESFKRVVTFVVKFVFGVVVPLADVYTDIDFTIKCFQTNNPRYGKVSGSLITNIKVFFLILTLPILFNWFKVARKPTTRWKLKAYIEGLLCQFMVPVYAWKSLRAPDNIQLKEKLWSLKIEETVGESLFQFHLQCYKMVSDGYDGNFMSILSLVISVVSLLYGFINFNLFQLYPNKIIPTLKAMKFACLNFIHYAVVLMVNLSIICAVTFQPSVINYIILINSTNSNATRSNNTTNTSLIPVNITDSHESTDNYELIDNEQIINNTNSSNTSSNVLNVQLGTGEIFGSFIMYIVYMEFAVLITFYLEKDWKYGGNSFCTFIQDNFIHVKDIKDLNRYINPLNISFGWLKGDITSENLLKLYTNCALNLIALSFYMSFIGPSLVFIAFICLIPREILFTSLSSFFQVFVNNSYNITLSECEDYYSSESCEQFREKVQRFANFSYFKLTLGVIGLVVGLVEIISAIVALKFVDTGFSLCVRKFVIRHVYLFEDDNETEMNDIERNEHEIENTNEVASNNEAVIETRMVTDDNNGTDILPVDIHADEETNGQGDNTTDASNQVDKEDPTDLEDVDIPPEQVTLLDK